MVNSELANPTKSGDGCNLFKHVVNTSVKDFVVIVIHCFYPNIFGGEVVPAFYRLEKNVIFPKICT